MKKFTLFLTLCAFSTILFANDVPKTASHAPRNYIMMKHGKLTEVTPGHRRIVRKDVTLVNETTIHPNGSIDISSGQNIRLQEGEYITMDGRIRKLKDMPHKPVKKH